MICNLGDPMSLRHPVPQTSRANPVKKHRTHNKSSISCSISLDVPVSLSCLRALYFFSRSLDLPRSFSRDWRNSPETDEILPRLTKFSRDWRKSPETDVTNIWNTNGQVCRYQHDLSVSLSPSLSLAFSFCFLSLSHTHTPTFSPSHTHTHTLSLSPIPPVFQAYW